MLERCRWSAIPTISSSTTRCWCRPSISVSAIGEISCPTRYFEEASSINFRRSVTYGLGVLNTSLQFRLAKMGLSRPPYLDFATRRLSNGEAPFVFQNRE